MRYDCVVGYFLYDVIFSGFVQFVEKVFFCFLCFIVRFFFWYILNMMRVINDNCRYKFCIYGIYLLFMIVFFINCGCLEFYIVVYFFWLIVFGFNEFE